MFMETLQVEGAFANESLRGFNHGPLGGFLQVDVFGHSLPMAHPNLLWGAIALAFSTSGSKQ